jgi:hypothetical protein
METDPKDQSRGMAPSEMMRKVSAIDPMGLLGDTSDNDQEMREVEDGGATPDADPAIHKNVHVISAGVSAGCRVTDPNRTPTTPLPSTLRGPTRKKALSLSTLRDRPLCPRMLRRRPNLRIPRLYSPRLL